MKFFTRTWCQGDLPDGEWQSNIEAYQRHLELIKGRLPKSVRAFIANTNLHDGLLYQARLTFDDEVLNLSLVCGDIQTGYFDLSISYANVDFQQFDQHTLANIINNSGYELLYDEFDIASQGQVNHQMLFFPSGELGIAFSDLSYSIQKRVDRNIQDVERQLMMRN